MLLFCNSVLQAEVIDFQDWMLDVNSAWNGPVPADTGIEQPGRHGGIDRVGEIQSGGLTFVNRHNLRFGDWSGFGISNQTDTDTSGWTNQMSAYTGSGAGDGNDNYAIAFGYLDNLDPTDPEQLNLLPYLDIPSDHHVSRLLVTNTTYAALSILEGDNFANPFGGPSGKDPDFFRLSVYGVDENGILLDEVVESFLADYRTPEKIVVNEWTPLDLSALADAQRLYFNLDSTVTNNIGMATPAYFAIDNIVLERDQIGDVDQDGILSISDVDLLCDGLAHGSVDPQLDLNSDGIISRADLDSFLMETATLRGDTNFDRSVQFDDFLLFSGNFGTAGNWSHGDFDCDGLVGFPDFLELSQNFGTNQSNGISVPEPRSFGAIWLIAIGLWNLRIAPKKIAAEV